VKLIILLLVLLVIFTSCFTGIQLSKGEPKLGLLYAIIVANSSLKDTVQDFVKFKESQGFDVIVEDVPTIQKNYQGIDDAEKIRNFLKDKTKDYIKSFTLLVGEPYDKKRATSISTGGDLPMRIIEGIRVDYFSRLPVSYSYPTDFYYADLEGNWDKNNNGKYGEMEYDELTQTHKKIDEINEKVHNFVGRIPFSETTIVKNILANVIDLWCTTLTKKVLLATAKFEKEGFDHAPILEKVRLNTFEPAGFSVITLYEKEGNNPSTYPCTAPLNEDNFKKYLCGNDIVLTNGHGGVYREVWYDNNKNGIVDSNEIEKIPFFTLDDLNTTQCKTKIWIDFGCVNAFKSWEIYYNTTQEAWFVTADAILKKGIAAVVIGSTYESPVSSEDIETICNTVISRHLPVGEWLYNEFYSRGIKQFDSLAFNILSDPSFGLFDDSLIISGDTTPPTIEITFPTEGIITNETKITISGRVADVGSGIEKVLVNLNPVTVTNNSFVFPISLRWEGEYLITIMAIDKAGNQSTKVVKIIHDTQPPYLEIKSPLPNSFTNKTETEIWGTVKDEIGGVEELKIQGERVEILPDGSFNKKVNLSEGENIIKLIAVDKAGNQKEEVLTLYVDTSPPEIFVSLPKEVHDELLNIAGYVKDGGLSGIKDSSILINGEKIELTRSLSFTHILKLNLGDNEIKFEIEDNAGNKSSKTFIVKYFQKTIMRLQIGNKTMYINDSPKEIDVPPQIVEGRTLLPIRYIVEPLGGKVSWDSTEKKVTIVFKDILIELWIGKNLAKVNGNYKLIDPNNPKVVPMIIQGRTMLPVRFVAENLGCKVDWDPNTKTVTITYPKD